MSLILNDTALLMQPKMHFAGGDPLRSIYTVSTANRTHRLVAAKITHQFLLKHHLLRTSSVQVSLTGATTMKMVQTKQNLLDSCRYAWIHQL